MAPWWLRPESFTAPSCTDWLCFWAASESSLGAVGHATSTLQSDYRIFMPVTEGDWMRVLRGSVLWEQVCLNSAFPWASMTRQVGNLEGKNWFKNINRSLLFPFIGIPLPAQSTEAYCIHQFTVLSLYNYVAVSSPSRQTRRLRFRKANLATVTPLYTEGVV